MTLKRRLLRIYIFFRIFHQWKRLVRRIKARNYKPSETPSLVIVPCDPWSVGGSRGDEAMIMAVIHQYRIQYHDIPIHIVCAKDGENYIRNLPIAGITHLSSWNGNYPLDSICEDILSKTPTDIVLLGADCIDGHYSSSLSLMLISIYDICSNLSGVRCKMMGFSFNANPSWMMILALKSLNNPAQLSLRDEISLKRYNKQVGVSARLVADAAFMLQPQTDFAQYDDVKLWVDSQHADGHIIIGFNFHPMLRSYSNHDELISDALIVAKNVEQILNEDSRVSFILIPHDDRSHTSDNLVLSMIYDYLKNNIIGASNEYGNRNDRIYYSPDVHRASQLKSICGLLDGLVSSRMHLAIAALGMNVPVFAATYQDKFEGLFRHFNFNDKYLLNPEQFLSQDMVNIFNAFIEDIPMLKEQIKEKLPYVIKKSKQNIYDE